MPGPRMTTDALKGRGKKHLSKKEEADRRAGEVSVPVADKAKPPKWLPEELKKAFRRLGKLLIQAGLYTELDADTLGRYLVAQDQWIQATQEASRYLSTKDQEKADAWGKIQERYFKQARSCANDMGLTVTSRCRLVVPGAGENGTSENPILSLLKGGASDSA